MSYIQFQQKLTNLENWDPNTQLITRDLELKAKKKLSGCQKIIQFFTQSRSRDAVRASKNLQILVRQYKKELKNDKNTLDQVKLVAESMQERFTQGNHVIRKKSRRKSIEAACQAVCFKCIRLENPSKNPNFKPKNLPELVDFLKKANPKTPEEATDYLKDTLSYLTMDVSYEQANQILIHARQMTQSFKKTLSKSDTAELRAAHAQLKRKIRKKTFKERLKENQKDLAALKATYAKGPANETIQQILDDWQHSLDKKRPIDMPTWFHATPKKYINKLLDSEQIEVRKQKAYRGAFASTNPEQAYGDYCIALGSTIAQTKKLPIITNVEAYSPIYIGTKPGPKNIPSPSPTVWAGFQENISLKKPDKEKDPLGYYAHTNFCLLGCIGSGDIDTLHISTIEKLKEKDIKILEKPDFIKLVALVQGTFHCHLPSAWQDAHVPAGCSTTGKGNTLADNGVIIQ